MDFLSNQEPGLLASKVKEDGSAACKRELSVSPEKRSFLRVELFSKYIDEKLGFL